MQLNPSLTILNLQGSKNYNFFYFSIFSKKFFREDVLPGALDNPWRFDPVWSSHIWDKKLSTTALASPFQSRTKSSLRSLLLPLWDITPLLWYIFSWTHSDPHGEARVQIKSYYETYINTTLSSKHFFLNIVHASYSTTIQGCQKKCNFLFFIFLKNSFARMFSHLPFTMSESVTQIDPAILEIIYK